MKAVELPLPGEGRALDIGTGTGDLAKMLAGKTAEVVGLDASRVMLDLAMRKASASGLEQRVCFTQGDAVSLPFSDDAFECVATAFTARNVGDLPRLFSEMHRVAKPHHPVVCLEFTYPSSRWVRFFYYPYLRYVLPLLGILAGGDRAALRYLSDSIRAFPGVHEVKTTMEAAGLDRVTIRLLNLGPVSIHVGWKDKFKTLEIVGG